MYEEINSNKSVCDDHKLKYKSTQNGIRFLSFKMYNEDGSFPCPPYYFPLSALSNT